jgi:hypothetical protein
MEGWIKIHRQLKTHWVFKDAEYLKAWITILMDVNHKENIVCIHGELIECGRGQSINSLNTWSELFGSNWSVQRVRTFFKLLEKSEMINTQGLRKTTRITVCNYEAYQSEQQTNNRQVTHKQQATNTQLTTNKNEKNEKNEKNVQSEIVDARGLTQKQTAFLTWFNSMMLKHKNVNGKFRSMTKTDKNNLRNLRAAYEDITDWEKAFVSMTKSKWVIDNNKCTVDHFLRMDNFVKYLNEFEVTQSDKKKIRAPWD